MKRTWLRFRNEALLIDKAVRTGQLSQQEGFDRMDALQEWYLAIDRNEPRKFDIDKYIDDNPLDMMQWYWDELNKREEEEGETE